MTRTVNAERSISALHGGTTRPVVTYVFLGLCLLVTVPSLFSSSLYRLFSAIEPREHVWQVFTAAFQHGWPGFPAPLHLALNTFLIYECGRPCERLLGHGRFAVLSILALGASAVLQTFTGGANGSSLVIWAWGPPLFVALRWARREDRAVGSSESYQRIRGVLILMYVIIVVAMGAMPYLAGWRGNPFVSLLRANAFHLAATGVGVAFALAARRFIGARLAALGRP